MKKILFPVAYIYLCLSHVSAVNINSIEQLDDLALFSFAAFGDNNGRGAWNYDATGDQAALGMSRLEPWIKNNDAFVLGVGDHGAGNRTVWFDRTETDSYYRNHYYPVLGDNGNETSYVYGNTADQATWGRGWVQFQALNNFFNRNTAIDQIEFRQPQSSPVYSSKSKSDPNTLVPYPDQLCDYYARRTEGAFTFHIIGLNVPDPGVLAERSKNFMMSKLTNIASFKTDYDVVIVNAHKASWVKRSQDKGWLSRGERDFLMTTADLILCGDDHIYRRQNEFDGDYDGTEAIWMNIGQPCSNTGSGRGYLDFHMFDNPPRFSVQYILTETNSTRKLHVNTIQLGSLQRSMPAECMKPYLKYINGPFVSINWSNFPHDGSTPPPPPPAGEIIVSKNSSWKYLDNGSNQGTGWRATGFNDGSWSSGNGALGYGDSGSQNTTVSYGSDAQNKHVTTYFRKSFNISNASTYTSLQVAVRRDDGVVVYLNGNEVARDNMPSGSIAYNTLANGHAANADETTYHLFNISPSLLQEGNNVIAAEVHQDATSSSDISFDLELSGDTNGTPPPPPPNDPVVTWELPSGDITLNEGDDLNVRIAANDNNGISRVYLYKNNVELARSEGGAPYEWNAPGQNDPELLNLQEGVYTFRARAVDNNGDEGEASIVVTVLGSTEPPQPINSLLDNPSFEGGTTSWVMGSSASVSTDARQGGGSYSLKLLNSSSPTKQTITLQPNTDYTLSAWVLASGLTSGSVVIDTQDVFDSASQTPGGSAQFVVNANNAPAWTQFTGSFNSASVPSVTIRIFTSASPVGTAYVDNIELIALNSPATDLELWMTENSIADLAADDDSDGLVNLMEFALGGDPNSDSSGPTPEVSRNAANIEYKFLRSESTITYVLEKSTDLQSWTDHVTVNDSHGVVGTTARVFIPESEMSNGKLFLRLRVEN